MAAVRVSSRAHARRSHAAGRDRDLSVTHADLEARPTVELWREYAEERTPELRNYFVEKYLHLVRYNAERVYSRLPDEVDIADLVSAGLFGLMDAIHAFDLDGEELRTLKTPLSPGHLGPLTIGPDGKLYYGHLNESSVWRIDVLTE